MANLDKLYNIPDLRAKAKQVLPKGLFEFIDRATEDEVGLRNNRAAFERIKFRPHVLNDVSGRSTETTLFGKPMAMPYAIAPTGAAGLTWYHGELELAKAAAAMKIPFTLATGSNTSMEQVAKEAGGRLWFQLYVWHERELSYELIRRADRAGFEALIVTVDTIVPPNREYNARNGFNLPFHPTAGAVVDIMGHPGWLARVIGRYMLNGGLPRYENYPAQLQMRITANPAAQAKMRQDSLSWDDIKKFRALWPRVLMVKGIVRGDDAVRAVECGADAVIVSNHGARNMDSTVATIDAVAEVAAAVGDRATVLLDSGVRRGSDVAKALALGAHAVLAGRPTLYGCALGGAAGAGKALSIIKTEFDKTLAYLGCNNVSELNPDLLVLDPNSNMTKLPERR
jgi:isopentenyl diphosphate isomerase/L-lactate dehydrogenase-like FMN-dependent dehydrogenase